jgi:vacuolar-type H+-ATPase catalytic subunit A/Vma1
MKTFNEMKKIEEEIKAIKDKEKELKKAKKLLAKKQIQEQEEAYLKKCRNEKNTIELFLSDKYFEKIKDFITTLENSELNDEEILKFISVRLELKEGWILKFRDHMSK